jgi:hypothetical protein
MVHQPPAASSQDEGGKSPNLPILRVRTLQSIRQIWAYAYFNQSGKCAPTLQSIRLICVCAHFNQSGKFARARTSIKQANLRVCTLQSIRQFCPCAHFNHLSNPIPLHGLGTPPPLPLCDQLWTSLNQASRDPHTPSPLLCMMSSDAASWPRSGHLATTQTFRLKSGSSMSLRLYDSSRISPVIEKAAFKVQCVSV